MSNGGITTILSRSGMPEKIADVTEKASENKQQMLIATSQDEAQKRINTVQKPDEVLATDKLRREKEKKEQQERRKRKRSKRQGKGENLDLEA